MPHVVSFFFLLYCNAEDGPLNGEIVIIGRLITSLIYTSRSLVWCRWCWFAARKLEWGHFHRQPKTSFFSISRARFSWNYWLISPSVPTHLFFWSHLQEKKSLCLWSTWYNIFKCTLRSHFWATRFNQPKPVVQTTLLEYQKNINLQEVCTGSHFFLSTQRTVISCFYFKL